MRSSIIEGFLKDNGIVHNVGKSALKLKARSPKTPPFFPSKAKLIQRSALQVCFGVYIFIFFKKINQNWSKTIGS